MSEGRARVLLGILIAVVVGAAATVDLPELTDHRFWSDGATYYSMAWSLVEDHDLRFEARDLLRVRRRYGSGPDGVFLKRSSGGLAWEPERGFPWLRRIGEDEPRIYYAKALAYPVLAAPFVRVLGDAGFLTVNALALGLFLVLGYSELRRRAPPGWALAATLVLVGATVTPLYVLWVMPELVNVALIMAGLVAWRRGWPLLAAVLLGIATHSKPSNILLALPLGVEPLVSAAMRRASPGRALAECLRRGAVLVATIAVLYGANLAVTGEWNYQGGRERKTFIGRYPFDETGATFGNTGTWMTTNQVGPLVEGKDDAQVTRQTGPPRASGEIRASFVRNLGYFWVGRFGGAIAYFFPVTLAVLLFVLIGPRDAHGGLALAALMVSYLAYIWVIPDNWYGGGGTVGNRYFLNLAPLAFFLVPRGRHAWVAAGGLAGLVLVGPILARPVVHSLRPGMHAVRATFRVFPPELTMLNDLSLFTEPWRKKRPVGDTEGDAHKHWPADPRAYYLYFLDDGTCRDATQAGGAVCGRQEHDGRVGFWLRPGGSAEIVLRALEPVAALHVRVAAGAGGADVQARIPGDRARLRVAGAGVGEAVLEPGAGFGYYDTFLYVVRLSERGEASAPPPFVSIELDTRPRQPPSGSPTKPR